MAYIAMTDEATNAQANNTAAPNSVEYSFILFDYII